MLRSTPPIATWILNQFGALPENESAIGDLVEQYQRGKGSIWYWRQVLVIVFVGLYREVRQGKTASFWRSSFPNLVRLGRTPVHGSFSRDDALQVASSLEIGSRIIRQPHTSRDASRTHGEPHASVGFQCPVGDPEYIDAASGWPIYRSRRRKFIREACCSHASRRSSSSISDLS